MSFILAQNYFFPVEKNIIKLFFKSVFYCYVHQFTYQNTTFMYYLEG